MEEKEKKEKVGLIQRIKKDWKNPQRKALIKLCLYLCFFAVLFLIMIISNFISSFKSDGCEGIYCDLKHNNYEYRMTINDDKNKEDSVLLGYVYNSDSYYSTESNDVISYFKYVDDTTFEKIDDVWQDSVNDNIYTNNDNLFLDINNIQKMVESGVELKTELSYDETEKTISYGITASKVSEVLAEIYQQDVISTFEDNSVEDATIKLILKDSELNKVFIDFSSINGKTYLIEYKNIDLVTSEMIKSKFN